MKHPTNPFRIFYNKVINFWKPTSSNKLLVLSINTFNTEKFIPQLTRQDRLHEYIYYPPK